MYNISKCLLFTGRGKKSLILHLVVLVQIRRKSTTGDLYVHAMLTNKSARQNPA